MSGVATTISLKHVIRIIQDQSRFTKHSPVAAQVSVQHMPGCYSAGRIV